MIRPALVALALSIASSAHGMPYAPLQQSENLVIPVRQGCGPGRQLVDGICVQNYKVRAAVRKCRSRGMRMVNGRCEPRARPAAAPRAARPATASDRVMRYGDVLECIQALGRLWPSLFATLSWEGSSEAAT
jgi:hypothetical protein